LPIITLDKIYVALIYVPISLLQAAGVHGLLDHDGLCGWGWCAPTVLGWSWIVIFWIGVIGICARFFKMRRNPFKDGGQR
jgi:hypothetical protein